MANEKSKRERHRDRESTSPPYDRNKAEKEVESLVNDTGQEDPGSQVDQIEKPLATLTRRFLRQ